MNQSSDSGIAKRVLPEETCIDRGHGGHSTFAGVYIYIVQRGVPTFQSKRAAGAADADEASIIFIYFSASTVGRSAGLFLYFINHYYV